MSGQTPLTPTRLVRIRALFDEALEYTGSERDAYLARACGGDRGLQHDVQSLLDALDRSGTWEPPGVEEFAEAVAAQGEGTAVGTRIGVYEITRLIGYGGMGAVYEGVRNDDQFHKRVALKFLRRGFEGDLAIRRFRYERQILANLDHRNIAALLDGGVTPDGQPYIVMEYVDGEPITRYAARHTLDVRARIQLLRQVCTAVQHAHQNLVVHRDLKPGNILVAADGTVKLLDFGIARLLRESEGADQLPPTQGGVHAFTPDYASPEQVRGLPVGTPSDVYSLGVIACELLSGHRPFALDGRLFSELQSIICTEPAPAPSSLVTDEDAAQFGAPNAARVRRQLTGDLDAIILQALRKEPERRYGSADQFARDLQRHLEGLPVSARRDRLGYRTAKFLRRRRVEVAAGVLVAATLVSGMIVSTRQARRAELERTKTEQANEFLSTMLAAVDPSHQGRDVTVAQVLSQAARDIEGAALDPEVEAQIRHTLGQTYWELGHYDSAAVHMERAVVLRQQVYGLVHMRTGMSLSYLAALADSRGDIPVAESLTVIALDIQRRLKPRQPSELATTMDNLARYVHRQGRFEEAMQLQLESIEIRRVNTDPASLEALPYSLANLSVMHQYRDEYAQAESLSVEALEAEARVNGRQSLNYGSLLRNVASVYDALGRVEPADTAIRAAQRVLFDVVGASHPEYLRVQSVLATLRANAKDWPAAEAAARTVVDAIGGPLHESHSASTNALQQLGFALAGQGRVAGADSALERSLAIRRQYLAADHWSIAAAAAALGYHYGTSGREAEGEQLLREAYPRLVTARGERVEVTRRAALWLAEVLERSGRAEEAEHWKALGRAPTGEIVAGR